MQYSSEMDCTVILHKECSSEVDCTVILHKEYSSEVDCTAILRKEYMFSLFSRGSVIVLSSVVLYQIVVEIKLSFLKLTLTGKTQQESQIKL